MRRDKHGHYTDATDARVAIDCVDDLPVKDRAKVIDEDRRSRQVRTVHELRKIHRRRPVRHLRILASTADQ